MNIAIGENTLMNKFRLIQLRLMLAAGALLLLSPGRVCAQAPPSTQASSPQPSPTASPSPTARPQHWTSQAGRAAVTAEKRRDKFEERPSIRSVSKERELNN